MSVPLSTKPMEAELVDDLPRGRRQSGTDRRKLIPNRLTVQVPIWRILKDHRDHPTRSLVSRHSWAAAKISFGKSPFFCSE